MKRLIPLFLSLLIFSQATVHASDCEALYAKQLVQKQSKQHKYNNTWNRSRGNLSYNSTISLLGIFVGTATGSLPIVMVAFLTPSVISTIKNLPSREERVSTFKDESNKKFRRFVKRMQKDVSEKITQKEISALIQGGFDSGLYCTDESSLYSPKDIRKYVENSLFDKYSK